MGRWLYQINRCTGAAINALSRCGSGWRASLGLSLGAHAALLGGLALVAAARPAPLQFETLLGELVQTAPETAVRIDPPVEAAVMRGSSSGGREGPAGPIAAGIETARESAARKVDVLAVAGGGLSPFEIEARLPPASDLAVSALGKKLGKGFALGGGMGSGVGDGHGSGSGSQFFEIETAGTRFVYVIDGSGSMTEPHSEARSRLERVKIELVRSIGGLPEEMEFFVIFFNRLAVPMPAEKLQRATLANKQKYLEWCVRVRGGGGTDPRAALKQALELRPDVIYLLTDGAFSSEVVSDVSRWNTRGSSIHTFCFGDPVGETLLKQIAEKNHGAYKFVP